MSNAHVKPRLTVVGADPTVNTYHIIDSNHAIGQFLDSSAHQGYIRLSLPVVL